MPHMHPYVPLHAPTHPSMPHLCLYAPMYSLHAPMHPLHGSMQSDIQILIDPD